MNTNTIDNICDSTKRKVASKQMAIVYINVPYTNKGLLPYLSMYNGTKKDIINPNKPSIIDSILLCDD